MRVGLTATLEHTVADADTALALSSGDLPVLGTPRLLAWCEAASCLAIAAKLPPERTSVGTRAVFEHRAACAVGTVVHVKATVNHVDGRLLRFEVSGVDAHTGVVLGHGELTRVVVDRERFLARIE
jgi:predicted thioesterase